MRTTALAALTGLALASAASIVAALLSTTGTVGTPIAWEDTVGACTSQADATAQQCLTQAWTTAVNTDQLTEFATALNNAKDADTGINEYCHQAGHDVGKYVSRGDITTLRTAITSPDTCDNALMHGTLDAFGLANPDKSQVAQVAELCTQLTDPVDVSFCAEGLGHASWQHAQDPQTSAEWCAHFTPGEPLSACVTGIAMQQLNQTGASVPAENAREVLEPTCQVIQAQITDPDAVASCYREVAGAWAQDVAQATWQYARDRQDGRATPEQTRRTLNQWEELIARCQELAAPYQHPCRERTAELVEWIALDHRPSISTICSVFPDQATRAYCLQTRRPYNQ